LNIEIPDGALVVLIGPSGAGKSTFARRNFLSTEIVSSDACRGLVSDDENDQSVSRSAFELVHFIARKRLELHRLTVIDATSVRREDRKPLIDLAREHHVLPVAIVFDISERVCLERNSLRPDRDFGPHVVRRQQREMHRGLGGLRREGFRYVYTFSSPEEVEAAEVVRTPLWTDRRDDHGPFDVIGDVHGCYDELVGLLGELGYEVRDDGRTVDVVPPNGRKAVFLGDYGDRGPKTPQVYRLVMSMVAAGTALALPGNHDVKLARYLEGRRVQITHGLQESIDQLKHVSENERETIRAFVDGLVSHYVLDDGKLVVAHGGLPAGLHGRSSRIVRDTALYGVTTGRTDDYGLPERIDWAADYRGDALVVYGHTPVAEAVWRNGTINIDTGCVFGGKLSALRYPEREIVSVPARAAYATTARPFLEDGSCVPNGNAQLLDIADFQGRRVIQTRLMGGVSLSEASAAAALEAMARFAVDPSLLIYLPPTMSPPNTSMFPGYLEHPAEAFAYYRERGVGQVICQMKHMGSRAIVVTGRDDDALRRRFGASSEAAGIIYTRTGRRFFDEPDIERRVLGRVREALEQSALWDELETDWVALDCELMPWSVKAQQLIRDQYAAVGAAALGALDATIAVLEQAEARGLDVDELLQRDRERLDAARRYANAYRGYCWPVDSLDDLKLAPFQILAVEGEALATRDHLWHMEQIAQLCDMGQPLLHMTDHRLVDLLDPDSIDAGSDWWEAVCASGGEGMVVKPLAGIVRGERSLLQPAIKVRGREYLRIIYGPDYDRPEHLERLRRRSNGRKQGLALREFALGIEALERFVRFEPLHRIHECVFGVLAMESEPVDPRL
jgi:protein phosphatase